MSSQNKETDENRKQDPIPFTEQELSSHSQWLHLLLSDYASQEITDHFYLALPG